MDVASLNSYLENLSHDPYGLTKLSVILCLIPAENHVTETSELQHVELINKISMFYYLLFSDGFLTRLISGFYRGKFNDWICSFILLCFLHDSIRGSLIIKDLINAKNIFFFDFSIDTIATRVEKQSYWCIFLYAMLKYSCWGTPECTMNLLTELLSSYDIKLLGDLDYLHILNLTCSIMGSLTDLNHIRLLFQFYIDKIDINSYIENNIHYLAIFSSLIGNFIAASCDQSNKNIDAYTEIVIYAARESSLKKDIIRYLLFSLLRHSIQFHKVFGMPLINETIISKIFNLVKQFIHRDLQCVHTDGISILCVFEIELICLLVHSRDSNFRIHLFGFNTVSTTLQSCPDFVDVSTLSYSKETVYISKFLFNYLYVNRNKKKLSALIINMGTLGYLSTNEYINPNEPIFESTLSKIVNSRTGNECFIEYFLIKSSLDPLKLEEYFIKIAQNEEHTFDLIPVFKNIIISSIESIRNNNGMKNVFNRKFCFTNHLLNEENITTLKALLVFNLFIIVLTNVSPLKRFSIIRSPSIKNILCSILRCLFDKIPSVSHSFLGSPKKYFKIDNFKSVGYFVFSTLLHLSLEAPFVFVELSHKLDKKTSKSLKTFCNDYLSSSIILRQLDYCHKVFDDSQSIKICSQKTTNTLVAKCEVSGDNFELLITIPSSFPYEPIKVQPLKHKVYRSKQLIADINKLQLFITCQKENLADGLKLWKRNLDRRIEGVEPCVFCYCALNPEDFSLPQSECAVCHTKTHRMCLVILILNLSFRLNGLKQQIKNYAPTADQTSISLY
ncbi:hypothetical protein MXB_363 [Myxobolus squamalis]|nr:hypothetical protein MXB_363 [Myxobolus squamalis]